jgi:hypothetical protein
LLVSSVVHAVSFTLIVEEGTTKTTSSRGFNVRAGTITSITSVGCTHVKTYIPAVGRVVLTVHDAVAVTVVVGSRCHVVFAQCTLWSF